MSWHSPNSVARVIGIVTIWIVAILAAMAVDLQVARWLRDTGIAASIHRTTASELIKELGDVEIAVAMVVVVAFVHPLKRWGALFALLAWLVSGLNGILKWVVGRTRPFRLSDALDDGNPFYFDLFRGGIRSLFHQTNLSFPSGHACLAFAMATALAMLWPQSKWPWIGFLIASIVAAERVAENAHWLSDVVAAAALGVLGVRWLGFVATGVYYRHIAPSAQMPSGSAETI